MGIISSDYERYRECPILSPPLKVQPRYVVEGPAESQIHTVHLIGSSIAHSLSSGDSPIHSVVFSSKTPPAFPLSPSDDQPLALISKRILLHLPALLLRVPYSPQCRAAVPPARPAPSRDEQGQDVKRAGPARSNATKLSLHVGTASPADYRAILRCS